MLLRVGVMEVDFLALILILYILVIAEKGAIKGFYGAVDSTVFLVALSVLTITAAPKVADVLGESRIIGAYLEQNAKEIVSAGTEKFAAGEEFRFLHNIPIPAELEAAVQSRNIGIINSESVQLFLTDAVKGLLIYAVAVVFTMSFFIIFLLILMILIHRFVKIPEVRMIDRVMGFVLGMLEGLVGVWIVLSILHLFEFTETAANILQYVRTSPVLSMMDDSNLIYLAARYLMGVR